LRMSWRSMMGVDIYSALGRRRAWFDRLTMRGIFLP